jgi:hypothetical protein
MTLPGGLSAGMAIYDDSGGTPAGLELNTSAAYTISAGRNVFPVSGTLPQGTYWIAADFSAAGTICNDGSGSDPSYYVASGAGSTPGTMSGATATSGANFSFFMVAHPYP